MAGHSKWANIKHRKGKADKIKGKIFSRLAKEIISAVKLGGPDHKSNPRLRLAIQKAREANMPSENIERNVKKASNPDQSDYFDFTYELYGYGGVGIIAEGMSDNKNRLSSDMRIATNKCGGTVATPGAVAFNFDRKGVIRIPIANASEEALFTLVTEAGAEDFEADDEGFTILTDPAQFAAVKEAIDQANIKCDEAALMMMPKATISCDAEAQKANLALIDWLENLDDVDAVYHNMGAE